MVLVPQVLSTQVKTCRVMYYGPQGSGKRDNLRYIHRSIPPEHRLTLAVEDPERQIAFQVKGSDGVDWQVLLQAVDVGQERYRGAGMVEAFPFDAIVFAVHSGASYLDQSLASMEALKTYLDTWGMDLMGIPIVLQYNRREDPDTLLVDRLESLLNPWGLLSFPANSQGEGVREALKAVMGLAITHIKQNPKPEPLTPATPLEVPGGQEDDPTQTLSKAMGGALELEYGPPLPGTEIEEGTRARGDEIFDELRPPVVIPVRLPRNLLEKSGPIRILLEVKFEPDKES